MLDNFEQHKKDCLEAYENNPADNETKMRMSSDVYSFTKPTVFRNLVIPISVSSSTDSQQYQRVTKNRKNNDTIDSNLAEGESNEKTNKERLIDRQETTIKWNLLVYPAGNPGSDPPSFKTHVSIYLACASYFCILFSFFIDFSTFSE